MNSLDDCLIRVDSAGVAYPAGGIFSRHKHWALRDVSFDLHDGEVVGVIGRNGAGKSTLLKLLAGIISPDSGQVWQKPGVRASLLALQVGFLPELTGEENAVLSCVLLGLTRKQGRSKLDAIREFAEIGDAMSAPLSTYSSGMRARLGFGVALAASPDVLLIDEVLGVGDAPFRRKSAAMLRERIVGGQSAIVVSHNVNTLRDLCSKLVVIDKGRSVLSGPIQDVLPQYEAMVANG
ncbi:ATP-binding cassette domain-containing protein [Marinobacter sp. NFXS9]|uniref:ABC transporter ATP-binding protein n=1 Tax=Marinobacter sp. NFXS9 TaxID=2818433 RepID=UPI0032DE88A2